MPESPATPIRRPAGPTSAATPIRPPDRESWTPAPGAVPPWRPPGETYPVAQYAPPIGTTQYPAPGGASGFPQPSDRAGMVDPPAQVVPRRRTPWLLISLTAAVWIGVGIVAVVANLIIQQPPLEAIRLGP